MSVACRRTCPQLIFFCLLLGELFMSGQAQAQKETQKKKAAPQAKPRRAAVPELNLDAQLFQRDHSASAARRRLESTLKLKIAEVDRACQLTEAQKAKLLLAGTGDIIHFFDRYEEVRRKVDAIKNVPGKFQEFWELVQPLQLALEKGLVDPESLFDKSLHHLAPDQRARYQAVATENREFRRRAIIEVVVASLDKKVRLRDSQRQKLLSLLTSQVKLPRKLDYEYVVVWFQFAKIPEEKLKPLFDDMQWKIVNWNRSQYKGIEQWLKENNVWPERDEPE
jgi:hypothetical protein